MFLLVNTKNKTASVIFSCFIFSCHQLCYVCLVGEDKGNGLVATLAFNDATFLRLESSSHSDSALTTRHSQ